MRTNQINGIFNKTKGNKVKITSKELKSLAKDSIGHGDKYLEQILSNKIKELHFYQEISNNYDRDIQTFIKENYSIDFEILTSIEGIGEITAQKFLIEIDDIKNFTNYKQLTAFIGTDPSIKQSGTSIMYQGRISKRGNKYLGMWMK